MDHRTPSPTTPASSDAAFEERTTGIATRLGRLHVRSTGDGVPTVLWSSMFVDSHTWDWMVPLLPTGRRYLLVDPPGLGRSEALDRASDITGAADAATDLLDGLGIHGPVDWVGNAFGGHVGFKLAARPGVLRSLVAISSPAQPVAPALRRQINILLPILRAAGPVGPVRSAVLTAMLTDASAADDAIRRVVEESVGRPTRRSMALAVRSFILNRVDVTDELADLTVPSLFVASDDRGDWSPQDARAAADIAPDGEAVTVTRARTLIPLEQPEEVAAHVRRFWERLT
jgi:pimeloyl-ACP methyl ester carboxylesterase